MKTTYKNLVITAKLKESGVYFPNSTNSLRHNKFTVSVKNVDLKKQVRFDFYDSSKNFTEGIKGLSNEDLLNAFYCFVQDAIAGELSQDEFCNEFGYDYFDGRKIHRLCQKTAEKIEKIVIEDIYDFANDLQEATENL